MWEDSDTISLTLDLRIFESDSSSFSWDLSLLSSDSSSFSYLLTNNEIVYLDVTSTLPYELNSNELTSSNLKQYIEFYSGAYVVDNSKIEVSIIDLGNNVSNIQYLVVYEEGIYAYSGFYEQQVLVNQVPTPPAESSNIYDYNVINEIRKEIEKLPYSFDRVVATYKSKRENKVIKALLNGTNDYYIEIKKDNKKHSICVFYKQ